MLVYQRVKSKLFTIKTSKTSGFGVPMVVGVFEPFFFFAPTWGDDREGKEIDDVNCFSRVLSDSAANKHVIFLGYPSKPIPEYPLSN